MKSENGRNVADRDMEVDIVRRDGMNFEGEVWADPGLETLERIEALLAGYRLIRDEAFPAVRARFSLNESKQAVYQASLVWQGRPATVTAYRRGQEPVFLVVVADGSCTVLLTTNV